MVPVTFSVVNYLLYDIILWVDFWRKQGLNIGFTFIPARHAAVATSSPFNDYASPLTTSVAADVSPKSHNT